MNLTITKNTVQGILIATMGFTLVIPSIFAKMGALILVVIVMVWATLKVEGFYPKPYKITQAIWLGILGSLTIIALSIYIWA